MAAPAVPSSFLCQQANRQVFLSCDLTATATSYTFQKSTDGVTFTTVASPTAPQYLDTAVVSGTQYWYQVSAHNGTGDSAYTASQSVVPTPTGEMSLGQIRLNAQQRADRQNSQFVSTSEWNQYISQSMFELYDILIESEPDRYITNPAYFVTNGVTSTYPLPNGVLPFNDISGTPFLAPQFYRLMGIDLGINTSSNAWVSVKRFQFSSRNNFVFPNTSSTIYGVFNLQYRVIGTAAGLVLDFIPYPTSNQNIRVWYVPRMKQLLQDTDISDVSVSGWIEYVIVDAAIKALQKEESDVSVLMMQKQALIERITAAAYNMDIGSPDKISDTRGGGWYGGGDNGTGGNFGGF